MSGRADVLWMKPSVQLLALEKQLASPPWAVCAGSMQMVNSVLGFNDPSAHVELVPGERQRRRISHGYALVLQLFDDRDKEGSD